MNPDIVIIREGNGYRLLHGHLRLSTELSLHGEVVVDVPGDGWVKIIRTRHSYICEKDGQRLPMLCDYRSFSRQAPDDSLHWG